jgi:predicted transcriptional regulator
MNKRTKFKKAQVYRAPTKKLQKLKSYYSVFLSIVEKPRRTITSIAKNIGYTGRGKRRATISNYLNEMYEQMISLEPNLIMKTYDTPQWMVYLCKIGEPRSDSKIEKVFEKLKNDSKISYIVLISGSSDFFFTTRYPSFNPRKYDLEIIESSILYSPIYTIPLGWKKPFLDCTKDILNFNFKKEKGKLNRESKGILEWSDLQMQIFQLMRKNVRRPFTEVGRAAGVSSTTVKKHFYEDVLPCCEVAHYFFPNGYSFYRQSLFKIETKYEVSLVKAFKLLPCTTYVYPFENSLAVNFFHDNVNILMTFMKKMEERGVIERYSMFIPLWFKYY